MLRGSNLDFLKTCNLIAMIYSFKASIIVLMSCGSLQDVHTVTVLKLRNIHRRTYVDLGKKQLEPICPCVEEVDA